MYYKNNLGILPGTDHVRICVQSTLLVEYTETTYQESLNNTISIKAV